MPKTEPRWWAIIVKDEGPEEGEKPYKDAEMFLDAQTLSLEAGCEIETCVELNPPVKPDDVIFSVKLPPEPDPETILPSIY